MDAETWTRCLRRPHAAEPSFGPVPRTVGIEITGRCQLRCRHCFNLSGPENRQELPLAVLERLFDEIRGWGVRELRLSGGEPTVHRRFREVVDACHRRDLRVVLNSHGIYSRKLLSWAETAPVERFLISIDGFGATNDAIRGRGTFDRAVDTCRRLRDAGQRVTIAFHVGAANRGDVSPLAALAAEISVDFKVSPIRPLGRAAEELPDALIEPWDYLEVVREVTRLRRSYPQVRLLTDFDILDAPAASGGENSDRSSCKAGRTMINVNFDGEVYPCAFFITPRKEWSAGSVYRHSLTELWQCSPVFEPLRRHRKSDLCHGCRHYTERCHGGCPAIAYAATGFLDAHDPTCFAGLVEPPSGGLR